MPREREPADPRDAIRRHRETRLGDRPDVRLAEGERPHLHAPHELLVARDDLPSLARTLEALGATELDTTPGLEERLLRFAMPAGEDVQGAVTRLRGRGSGDAMARVAPHHVLYGLPFVQGGPAGFPLAADEIVDFSDGEGDGARVAVIDTGYTPKLHPWLDDRTRAAPDTLEATDVHPQNGWLDDESGHGTFIAGVVLQRAPNATIEIAKVLDTEGYGSELDVARAILDHADADIINLSLGCYSHDDEPPLAIAEALRHVSPTTVVVAAAGNDSTHRPLWPAAHKRVLAVAAVDDDLERASFSNFGWWVDAGAPGIQVLSTFLEFDEAGHTRPIRGREPQSFQRWARWSGTSFAAPKLAGEIAATMTRLGSKSAREAAAALFAGHRGPVDREVGAVFDI
jgi:subtilisin family serine protease